METIDRREDTPALRRQLAAVLRAQIENGTYSPGDKLPSAGALAKEHGVSIDTAHAALNLLQQEGLVHRVQRVGSVVTGDAPVRTEHVQGPCRIRARMPTQPERTELEVPPGVPLIEIARPGEDGQYTVESHLGHVTELEIT